MSHDVLDGFRRRLVAVLGTDRRERRSSDATDATDATNADDVRPAPLVSDGGDDRDGDDPHLRDLPDGAGCTEIWEHLSERQAEEGAAGERPASECQADD